MRPLDDCNEAMLNVTNGEQMFVDRQAALADCPTLPKAEPGPPEHPYYHFNMEDVIVNSRESYTKLETLRMKMQSDASIKL